MRLLLDTQLLLWLARDTDKLSTEARALIGSEANELFFSPVSIWEVAIKSGLGRGDFKVEPRDFRRGLLDNGYRELPITSEHAVAVLDLPTRHKDPFDRMLLAQAITERLTLTTADKVLADYPGPVLLV
jgi:PIN domain nuclease of toxin-antitoxin system